MNKILLCLFAVTLLASCESKRKKDPLLFHPELESVDGRIVMFYNVENLFDLNDDPKTNDDDFTPNGYKKWTNYNLKGKLRNLAEVIKKSDSEMPVAIGMAEVENKSVLKQLAREYDIKDANYQVIHENSLDERGIDVAFMYQERYFEYKSHDIIRFTFDLPNGKDDYTRDILHVEGSFKNDDEVHFFVNHWSSRREGKEKSEKKRMKGAGLLREKTDQILSENPQAKIIIMGDFNDEPFNKSVYKTLGATNKIDDGEPFYNLHYRHYLDKKGSIHYKGEWLAFDQMIVNKALLKPSKGFYVDKNSGHIFKEEFMLYRHPKGDYRPNKSYSGRKFHNGYSDHLPVYLTLSVD